MKINYLKDFIGDEMNLLLAASAFNLKKWMNNFIQLIILVRVALIAHALMQLKQDEKQNIINYFCYFLDCGRISKFKIVSLV